MEKQIIHKQIGEIRKEISPIGKDKKNVQQGYSFRGIEDAMNMLSPLLAKHGIYPVTKSIVDVRNDEVQSKSGTAGYHYVRRYTFTFYAEDGSSVDTTADGEAIDYGDKASNKAYSTAYREAFWKMFVVPFAADDIENHTHELVPPVIQYPAEPKKPWTPKPSADIFEHIKSQLKDLGHDPATLKAASDLTTKLVGLALTETNVNEIEGRLSMKIAEKEPNI